LRISLIDESLKARVSDGSFRIAFEESVIGNGGFENRTVTHGGGFENRNLRKRGFENRIIGGGFESD
jgi:hypothetical protein